MADFEDNPYTKIRRLVAKVLTDFAAGAITAAVNARSVVFFDRPVDIRGEQEGGGLDPIRVTLMPGNNSMTAWSSGARGSCALHAHGLCRRHDGPRPGRYLEWILGAAWRFGMGATPYRDGHTQITDVVLDAIEAADTDLEKRLALESEYEGWSVACDVVVGGTIALADMIKLVPA